MLLTFELEVGGDAALFTSNEFVTDAIDYILKLSEDSNYREMVVASGLKHSVKFHAEIMATNYLKLYNNYK